MTNRIIQCKLNFVSHLKKLNDEALAKQVYDEQLSNGYPGLATEAQELCKRIGIPDITKQRVKESSKDQWKQKIKEAVERKNGEELKEKINQMEKLEIMKDEIYEQNEYLDQLTLSQARTLFRVRKRTRKCKINQSSDRRNRETLWRCQSHILYSPLYQDLYQGSNENPS